MRSGEPFNPRFEACGFHPEEVVARRRDLTAGQKLLYDRFVSWARTSDGTRPNERAGEVWRSQANIATELGKSAKQIARDLAKLESADLLGHRNRDGRKSNTYFFRFHPDFQRTPTPSREDSQIERTPVSAQYPVQDGFERTSTSVQTVGERFGGSDLNGHPRPVISNLNGHPRPSNQKGFNQQSHTPRDSGWFEMLGKPGTVPTERAPATCKTHLKLGDLRAEFPMGGWESPEHFEAWWAQVVVKHPNKNRSGVAKSLSTELILAGTLKRTEFELGYTALAMANSLRWAEQNGRFAPNLWQLLDDHMWKHALTPVKPIPVRNDGYVCAEDYLRKHGMQ